MRVGPSLVEFMSIVDAPALEHVKITAITLRGRNIPVRRLVEEEIAKAIAIMRKRSPLLRNYVLESHVASW